VYNNFMAKLKSEFLIPYENKWVALTPDNKKVIASAKDVGVLSKKLKNLKIKHGQAIMMYVSPFDANLVL